VLDELVTGDNGVEVLPLLKPNDENVLEKEVVESQLIKESEINKTQIWRCLICLNERSP
jgi:hypothetical protein